MKNEDLTREKLQSIEQSELVEMYLSQQEELQRLQKITDLLSEEVKNLKAVRFGRSTEKDLTGDQLFIAEAFNEAEALASEETEEPAIEEITYRRRKRSGKKDADLSAYPVEVIAHEIPEDELTELFPDGYDRFPDEVYKTLEYHPATLEWTSPSTCMVHSKDKIHGVAPGQFCVVYDKDHHRCLGSGEITI